MRRVGDTTSRARAFAGRATTIAKGTSATQRLGIVAAGALAVTAPLGGFEKVVDVTTVRPLEPGHHITVGPFEVVVHKVVRIPSLEPAIRPVDGMQVLVVSTTVSNPGDSPAELTVLSNAMRVPEAAGVAPESPSGASGGRPKVIDLDDSTLPSELNPGLAENVLMTWMVPAAWDGTTVKVGFEELTWVEEDTTVHLSDRRWRDLDELAWSGDFPVEVRS